MMNDQNQGAIANPSSFENLPIGKKNKFQIPEYAGDEIPSMIPENNNPEPRPLGERLKKNLLKTKKEALEQLLTLVKINPKEFQQYSHMATEFLSFNDHGVQDRSLKIMVLYLNGGNILKCEAKAVIKVVIEKCLIIQKEEIRSNSEQVLYWYMDNKYEQLLLNELNDYLLNKNRKIVSTTLLFLANLLHNYGIKRMKSLQLFCKNLEILSSPAKPTAKNQTITLFKQVYRWLGQSCLKDFKMHAQVKEEIIKFGKQYIKEPLQIKRGIKKQQTKPGEINKPVYYMEEEENQNQQPMDVLSPYTAQWVDHLFKIQKWKQKKEELQQFIKKTKVNHILPSRETSHLIFLIKKLLADNNINIFYCGFYIIQNLSKGLKKEFSHIAKNILSQLFSKLKDSKPLTVQLTQNTLKSLLFSLQLQDFMQNIKQGLNDKSPLMKEEVLKFLSNFIQKKQSKVANLIKTFIDKIIQLTQDGAAKVRSQALQTLCIVKVTHGMKYFGEKIRKLDEKKLQTLELAKAPSNSQMMEIEEPMQVNSVSHPQVKELNTMKNKQAKQHQIEFIPIKQALNTKNLSKYEETSSVNSNGDQKVSRSLNLSFLDDLSSSSQPVRTSAYQQISNKYLSKDIKQFMSQIKSNSIRQSSPQILKMVLQIAKKYINNTVADLEITEYLIKHDWKKLKPSLLEFIQANRFTTQAEQLLKVSNILNVSQKIQTPTIPTHTLKSFNLQLQNNLITKMSSPIDSIRKEAAQFAISIWQSIPKISSQSDLTPANGWNEEWMSKFFNIVKYRLGQSSIEIIGLYCKLLIEMINKGISVKNRQMKSVIQVVYSNLHKGYPQIKRLFKEMVNNAPQYMFLLMQTEICSESNRIFLIQFITENNELFFKYADIKAFINSFLHILCTVNLQHKMRQSLDSLFNQIIQISGQDILQKQISKLKVINIQMYNQYLSKYNICLNKSNYHQSSQGKNYLIKQDRLKYWEEEQWHLKITSNHILKLANMMNNLGEPFNTLCTLFYMNKDHIILLNNLEYNFLVQYSDIFFKFIYWRSNLQNKQIIQQLLKFISRLIITVSFTIDQIDMLIFLKTIINIIERYKNLYTTQISDMLKRLFKINPQIQNNTLQFFINFLMENGSNQILIDQILNIFVNCYQNNLTDNLVQLARIPSVHKNQIFMKFIQQKCDVQHLTASGFRIQKINKPQNQINQPKTLLCTMGGPQNIITVSAAQTRMYIDMFLLLSSQQLKQRIDQMTRVLDPSLRIELHVKILYSTILPFFQNEIQMINMFQYIKDLEPVLHQPYQFKKTHLKDLTRILLYFLIDLSQRHSMIDKSQELIRRVNKCILVLMDQSQARHMLQILFLLAKRNIELNMCQRLFHLTLKCVAKIILNKEFPLRLTDNIVYIIDQTNTILMKHEIQIGSTNFKSFRHVYTDLFRYYPISLSIVQSRINKGTLHPIVVNIYQQYLKQTLGMPHIENQTQNQHFQRSIASSDPLKQTSKELNNILKSMGTVTINKLASIKKTDVNPKI